jgi:membrane fusion protein, multidrug efflux system
MNVINHPMKLKNDDRAGSGNTASGQPPALGPPPAMGQPPPRPPFKIWWRILLYGAIVTIMFGVGAYCGWKYLTVWQYEQSTDDAYVQADIVPIAPQVAGYINTVQVNDNQVVKAGQFLATIDPQDYQDAVRQAKADVGEAQAHIASISAQLSQQSAVIDEANWTIKTDQASDVFAQQNNQRFGTLEKSGSGSQQAAQKAASKAGVTGATVAKDQAALEAAKKHVDTLNAQLKEANATLEHNKAVLAQAQVNLGYTVLRSPVDGVVGERVIRVGLYVEPGAQLLAVVPVQAAYVVANYKETQLANVRAGQPVRIDVDTFAGITVRGIVNSIAPASGEEFALLPPDNATGNFTKIVQRVPVKITIDRSDPLAGRLLPGMSVTTTIKVGTAGTSAAKIVSN